MNFQYASWPMKYLQEEMRCGKYSAVGFSSPFLKFYCDLFLAQAQECMLEKSMIDNRIPLVTAKVALKLKELYTSLVDQLNNSITDFFSISRLKVAVFFFSFFFLL